MIKIKAKLKARLFLVTMALFLTACGQRGPLFLPEPEQGQPETSETEAKKAEDDREKKPGTE